MMIFQRLFQRLRQRRTIRRKRPAAPRLLLEQLESRMLMDSGLNRLFVAQVYRDLLNREAEAGGLASWGGLLDHGATPAEVVLAIENSPEYHLKEVESLYGKYLGRAADPLGLAASLQFLAAGGKAQQLQTVLLGSPEYFVQRGGGTVTGFLTAVYNDVLERPIGPSEVSAWERMKTEGDPLTAVAAAVVGSPEANRVLVASHYENFLHRPAELGGLLGWVHDMDLGAADEDIIAGIVGSPEYFALTTVGTQPPTITLTGPTSGMVTNTNVSVTGKVTDALSGVATLQAAVDAGSFVSVPFDAAGHFSFTTALALDGSADGSHTVLFQAADKAGNQSAVVNDSFTLDTTAPAITISSPAPGLTTSSNVSVTGQVTDALSGVATLQAAVDARAFVSVPFDAAGNFSFTTALALDGSADGSHTVHFRATDKGGNQSAPVNYSFTLNAHPDTQPPTITITGPAPGLVTKTQVTVTGQVTDDASVASLQAAVDSGAVGNVAFDTSGNFSFTTSLALDGTADGSHTIHLTATDGAGNVAHQDFTFTLDTSNPAVGTPPLDLSVATTVGASTQFLYTGSNPVQTGVAPGTINPIQAAVLRGKVEARDGTPLAGVTISVLSHPEFGSTLTENNGMFDMAVNGGGLLTVNYSKAGYLNDQRQIQAPWNDYGVLPDVAMIQPDSQVTAIDLTASTPIQVARGSVESDARGTRQATLLFAQGTNATMTLPDGTTQPLTTLHLRATEYTVGANGPTAMPAELPPTSAYTYAVEFSADEALAAGATKVSFDQPVISYVEDFLGFPVGGVVPVGYYDRGTSQWVAAPNGRIIKILSITGGLANVDIDGSGQAAGAAGLAALGITDAERQQLAALYQPGQTLWRVAITHFTTWDSNWGKGLPNGAETPDVPDAQANKPVTNSCKVPKASTIDIENQTLGETVNIAGTPFSLNYTSNVQVGDTANNSLVIPLSGATVPGPLAAITLQISIAGRTFNRSFAPQPNQSYTFVWDGKDAYGRTLQGPQPVTVGVGYAYQAVYVTNSQLVASFAQFGGTTVTGVYTNYLTLWKYWVGSVGPWDARAQGLGGWTLNVLNTYDPVSRIMYQGDGSQRSAATMPEVISTAAGNYGGAIPFPPYGDGGPATLARLLAPLGIATGADGSVYIADQGHSLVRRVGRDGIINTVAGTGVFGFSGDGGLATSAELGTPVGVAFGPDGSLYILDQGFLTPRIRRVSPDGIITTVAGNGTQGYSGDGGPATSAEFNQPFGIAVGSDGSLYIADTYNQVIRRVGPDGIITTVAGNGSAGNGGDGGPATSAELEYPHGVAVGPDGSLYIADTFNDSIRRVGPDGVITTVAGPGIGGVVGDGGPATSAWLKAPFNVAVGPDGSLYIADYDNSRVRRVGTDGIITTVAGNGTLGQSGDGGPATLGEMISPAGVALAPDGSLYILDTQEAVVRRVSPPLPGFSVGDLSVPSADGSEIYQFGPSGRQERTVDSLTGAVIYQFGYDQSGHLISVTDRDGNVTVIQRDVNGNPTAIVSAGGQTTTLSLDANGYLAKVVNPAGDITQCTYTPDGLMTTLTDPRSGLHQFAFDTMGRLTKDQDAAGGAITLARTDQANGFTVTETTGQGVVVTHQIVNLSTGDQQHIDTDVNGLKTVEVRHPDGSQTITSPDGTVEQIVIGPDPRFGMAAPVTTSLTVTTPGGLTSTLTEKRTATLSDPTNPLSLTSETDTFTLNGQSDTTVFDVATSTLTETSPAGRVVKSVLDSKGHVIETDLPGQTSVEYTYDAKGHLITVTQGNRTETFTYDATNNLSGVIDPLGEAASLSHDAAGRLTTQTLPGGQQVQFSYDAAGNLLSVTPPGRPAYDFTYTPTNLLQTSTGPGGNQTQNIYNLDKQLTQVTLADGMTIQLGYDSTGMPISLTDAQGTTTTAYDAQTGNVKSVTAPNGVVLTYGYDGSLPTDVTWSGPVAGSVHDSFNNNFQVATQSVDGANAVSYQYNADGLVTSAGDLTLSRSAQTGQLTGTNLGSVSDTLSYDPFGAATAYQASVSGTAVYAVQDTKDSLGRVTQETQTIGGASHTYAYTYDANGWLTGVTEDGAAVAGYTYDANGNRLSFTGPSGTVNGTYDNQDRLLQYGSLTYSYTANGDLATRTDTATGQTTAYTYDALGNLLTVVQPDGTRIDYVVDAQGQRIGKKINGALMQGFLYAGGRVVAELDGSGNVVSRFVYGATGITPEYMIKGGVEYRIVSDERGGPRLVVNAATGQVVQQLSYDAFGNVAQDTNPGFQPFGFAGGLYDRDTKLTRFGARDYDAVTGRWTAKDPIGFAGGSVNLYEYAADDPVNLIDLTGLESSVTVTIGAPVIESRIPGVSVTVTIGTPVIESRIPGDGGPRLAPSMECKDVHQGVYTIYFDTVPVPPIAFDVLIRFGTDHFGGITTKRVH